MEQAIRRKIYEPNRFYDVVNQSIGDISSRRCNMSMSDKFPVFSISPICNCVYDSAGWAALCYTIVSRIPSAIKNWNSISRPQGCNFFYSSGPAWFIVTLTLTCSTCSVGSSSYRHPAVHSRDWYEVVDCGSEETFRGSLVCGRNSRFSALFPSRLLYILRKWSTAW